MLPTLRDGARVVVDTGAYVDLSPQPGDVVLAKHPFHTGVWLVKRVDRIMPDGCVFVVGDNPAESTDSRSWGALEPSRIIGRVVGTT